MNTILVAILLVSFILVLILFLRERSIRIASEKCNSYYEKERTFLNTEIKIKNEKISGLKKEHSILYFADVAHRSTIKEYEKDNSLLENENTELRSQVKYWKKEAIYWRKEYGSMN